jgi:hypothetical protein
MADIANDNSKFKLTTNLSYAGSFVIIVILMITLLFSYYLQFFVDVDQMSLRARRDSYMLFGREYSVNVTVIFLILNLLVAKSLLIFVPPVMQIFKYSKGFMFHDLKNLYFGNEILPLQDVYKCKNDVSTELNNSRHIFWIHNLSGKSYWCYYVFEEDPKQLIAQIEALARAARAAA